MVFLVPNTILMYWFGDVNYFVLQQGHKGELQPRRYELTFSDNNKNNTLANSHYNRSML